MCDGNTTCAHSVAQAGKTSRRAASLHGGKYGLLNGNIHASFENVPIAIGAFGGER
jgi:hypothetical protein